VRIVELVVAGLFALGGLRAIWYWSRRPFEGTDVVDHLLYSLYLTGRIGLWFAFAGFFLIYASIQVQGPRGAGRSRGVPVVPDGAARPRGHAAAGRLVPGPALAGGRRLRPTRPP
jgi:hypothetical protein